MSQRVYYGKIGGKYYPMVFSLGAKKQLKSIKKVIDPLLKFQKTDLNTLSEDEKLKALSLMSEYISTTAEILIKQGAAYKNRFESSFRVRPGSAVDENGIWQALSTEEILLILEDNEIKPLNDVIIKCLTSGKGQIETQPNPKNLKKSRRVPKGARSACMA